MNTTDHVEARGRGRPLKAEADRKSATVKFRIREDLRKKLAVASEKSGRPISDEAELRLENSFFLEPLHTLLYQNGEDIRSFTVAMLEIIKKVQDAKDSTGRRVGSEDWRSSEGTRAAIRTAARVVLDHMAPLSPPPDAKLPPGERSAETEEILKMVQLGRILGLERTGQAFEIAEALARQPVADTDDND